MLSPAEIAAYFPWFFPVVAFLFGACIGSFLNVVIYRVPKNESIVTPGSHCGCGQPIKWHDNIPVLSWLILRGRARCCGRPFSLRYPSVELLTAALFVGCWFRYATHPIAAVGGMIFISCLVAATFIDLDHFIIPDVFTLGLGVTGLLLSLAVPALHGQVSGNFAQDALRSGALSLLGSFVGCAIVFWIGFVFEIVLQKEAMGFGDVKFVGAIGAFCGWQGAVFAMFGGAVVGTIWVFIAWIWQRVSGKTSPVSPPTEKPDADAETAESLAPLDVIALGTGVLAVIASFAVPTLHVANSGIFFLDSMRSGMLGMAGLLVMSGLVLWPGILLETLLKKTFIPFSAVAFAGALGALTPWPVSWLGFGRGLLAATIAGGAACVIRWSVLRLIRSRAEATTATSASPPDDATPEDAPAVGFGVHIPFGPMLAIAGGAYFLFFREFFAARIAEIVQMF